ncbi:MAG: 23S rRNA (guanosine(2251)-2'-O)-methyltransferase RlmB [Acidobacteriota bacterium]
MSDTVFGVHPVLEALRPPGRRVSKVLIAANRRDARVAAVIGAARRAGVAVLRRPARSLDRLCAGGRHQGVVALVARAEYAEPGQVVEAAATPPLFMVLGGVEDPRNLGAVIRSAAAAGADGIFLPSHGVPGLTGVCVKASAGAVDRVPIARVGNLVSFLNELKGKGIRVVGLDPRGGARWSDLDLTGPLAIVAGGEGRGLRRLARETCDALLRIPLRRGIESLNLSVAAAVVLFEAVRQRSGRLGAGGPASLPSPGDASPEAAG